MLKTVKDTLGKYYPELLKSSTQAKYKDSRITTFFQQSFQPQVNPLHMVVDSMMEGLCIEFNGNEVYVSPDLYEHTLVNITNTMESGVNANPKAPFDSRVIGSLAYLMCQNHTIIDVVGNLDQPIYVRLSSDFETFHSSVVSFNITNGAQVEIIEEVESKAGLCAVINYTMSDCARLCLTTFYDNRISATSILHRHVITGASSQYYHNLLGNGSAIAVDESSIRTNTGALLYISGCIFCKSTGFHSILTIEPMNLNYHISVLLLGLIKQFGSFTSHPVVLRHELPDGSEIDITDMDATDKPNHRVESFTECVVRDIMLSSVNGVDRFYTKRDHLIEQHYDS